MQHTNERVERFYRILKETPLDHSLQEYAFETRLMARIRSENRTSPSMLAWRMLPYLCGAIVLLSALLYQETLHNNERALVDGLLADSGLESYNLTPDAQ